MTGKDVKKALGASLEAEARRVDERFARGDAKGGAGARKKGAKKKAGAAKKGKARKARAQVSLPESENARLGELKTQCRQAGLKIKKGQLLRAGLRLLARLSPERLEKLLRETAAKDGKPPRRAG